MKLIAQVKLNTTKEQSKALRNTLLKANKAANIVSDYAWANHMFHQYDLHKPLYQQIRKDFGLSAQATVHILSKVSDAYKADKKTKRIFNDTGSISFDRRILSWKIDKKFVSIWTIEGRMSIPFQAGKKQIEMLSHLRGEANLVLCKGIFYLLQICEIPEPPEFDPQGFLGVDFGIINLATTSDGDYFSGKDVERVREKTTKTRKALQHRGSKSSKRHLKKLSGKESRFKKTINHIVSKKIVALAKDTCRCIVIEDLKIFNGRRTVSKAQRERLGNWAFRQLRTFIEYKARREGVPVIAINPRNTSRACSSCGFVSKKNRKSQALFSCMKCGFIIHADKNAAINLSKIGSVNSRIAVHSDTQSLPFLELQTHDFVHG